MTARQEFLGVCTDAVRRNTNAALEATGEALRVPVDILIRLIQDPVMACQLLLGWDLDTFQKIRLRAYWGIPEVIDSSGVSTGKTMIQFCYAVLRCLLIPNQQVYVYFPTSGPGIKEFWPYFERTLSKGGEAARLFERQCILKGGRIASENKENKWYSWTWKNGSRMVMPPPSMIQGAKTQTSLRFHVLVVDEWLEVEVMGDAIDNVLVDRCTAESLNQFHLFWTNHQTFLGHADSPSHKGYARYKRFLQAIRDGSQRYGLISFCYKDWTEDFATRLQNKEHIKSRKHTMPIGMFRRNYLGLWRHDGASYYPPEMVKHFTRRRLYPQMSRLENNEHFFLGMDVARGHGDKADFNGMVILKVLDRRADEEWNCVFKGKHFMCQFVYALISKGRNSDQLAGMFYDLEERFCFSNIVLDPGGGGYWLYDILQREEVEIRNAKRKVHRVCTLDDPDVLLKSPKMVYFSRETRGEFRDCVDPDKFLRSDDGLVDWAHSEFREAWGNGSIEWPKPLADRDERNVEAMPHDLKLIHQWMDETLAQIPNVRVKTKDDGSKMTSHNTFFMFESPTKKDAAYAAMYAWMAFVHWRFKQNREAFQDDTDNVGFAAA